MAKTAKTPQMVIYLQRTIEAKTFSRSGRSIGSDSYVASVR